jgi:hypothetical protein
VIITVFLIWIFNHFILTKIRSKRALKNGQKFLIIGLIGGPEKKPSAFFQANNILSGRLLK